MSKNVTPIESGMLWLEDRKINVELASNLGIGVVANAAGRAAVSISYARNGAVYLEKFRPIDQKTFFSRPRNVAKSLWNVDALRSFKDQAVVITEGEIDAVSCIQAGWNRTVSIPDGWDESISNAEHPGAKMQPLLEVEADLAAAPYVIIAADDDAVGRAFTATIAALLEDGDVRVACWPAGCKDANDVLLQHGEGVLSQCLASARRVDPPGCTINTLMNLPPMEERRILRTSCRTLNRFAAFEIGAISVSTGVPGSGKTTFATFIADQVRRHEHVRIGMACFETHPYRIRDQLSLIAGAPWSRLPDEERARIGNYFCLVQRRDFHNADEAHDLIWLRSMIKTLAIKEQCKLIIIDPWNEIDHNPGRDSMTQYINAALTLIRQWAEAYKCHIHIVAHPRKMLPNESGKTRAPVGYDVAESAAFTNKPSLGYTVHVEKDEHNNEYTCINTWKIRDRELYKVSIGETHLEFDQQKMIYRPIFHRSAA